MSIAAIIEQKLYQVFQPEQLEIIDDSARHAGHAGARPGGETHFRVVIISTLFSGMSRIERHRAVMDILKVELAEQIHALNISAKTPDEIG